LPLLAVLGDVLLLLLLLLLLSTVTQFI